MYMIVTFKLHYLSIKVVVVDSTITSQCFYYL